MHSLRGHQIQNHLSSLCESIYKAIILAVLSASLVFVSNPSLAFKGGGPYGAEVTRGQDLTGNDFSGKTLIKQDFKTGNLIQSILRQSNFKGAKLLGASFFDVDLKGADLSDADLRGADFSLANVTKHKRTTARSSHDTSLSSSIR